MSGNQYDLCGCGKTKQTSSATCRECYMFGAISPRRSTLCKCGQSKCSRSKQCKDCHHKSMSDKIVQSCLSMTDPISKFTYGTSNNPNHWVKIRINARKLVKNLGLLDSCIVCDFPHVDVCHAKAIKDWPETTPINVVNHPDNLLVLCKNCHWLFDHGHPSIYLLQNFYSTKDVTGQV